MNASTIEEEALSLPPRERAKLAERLLESLDNLPERDVEALWLDVSEHRAREIDQGHVQLVAPESLSGGFKLRYDRRTRVAQLPR
jgi:hypothetical protein